MTPQQLRLIYPMTKQPPAAALTLVFMAYALAPVFVTCAAIAEYHWTLGAGRAGEAMA